MKTGVANLGLSCLCLSACQARAIEAIGCAAGTDCPPGEASELSSSTAGTSGTLLTWDRDGTISSDNPFDIHGGWGRAWDCADVQAAIAAGTFVCSDPAPTPGCCTAWDASITGPDSEPGWSVAWRLGG